MKPFQLAFLVNSGVSPLFMNTNDAFPMFFIDFPLNSSESQQNIHMFRPFLLLKKLSLTSTESTAGVQTLLPLLHPFAQRQRAADLPAGPRRAELHRLGCGEVLWLLHLPGRAGSLGQKFGPLGVGMIWDGNSW